MTVIDYEYYEWLIKQIAAPTHNSYRDLFERMHNYEFVWIVPHDDNRVQDAVDLRVEFLGETLDELSLTHVSVLEVLVALSRRLSFIGGGRAETWAWKLIKNLRLHRATDPLVGAKSQRVDEALERLVWRTYDSNGEGGFFPLKNSLNDQTKVELWYQLNAYVMEHDGI